MEASKKQYDIDIARGWMTMVVGWDAIESMRFVEPRVKINRGHHWEHMKTQCSWPSIITNLASTDEQSLFYAENAPSHVSASTREIIRLTKPNDDELLAVPPSPDLNVSLSFVGDHSKQAPASLW